MSEGGGVENADGSGRDGERGSECWSSNLAFGKSHVGETRSNGILVSRFFSYPNWGIDQISTSYFLPFLSSLALLKCQYFLVSLRPKHAFYSDATTRRLIGKIKMFIVLLR